MIFATPLPAWAWLAVVCTCAGLAWLAYRRAGALIAPRERLPLIALRAATLLLLVAVLLRPVRVEPRPQTGGLVPILVDASASMSMTDGGARSRLDLALDLARSRIVAALQPRFVPQVFTFGEHLAPLEADVVPLPAARASRLGEALADLRDRTQDRRVPGIVVISDGAVTLDPSPAGAVPVHVIAVGAPRVDHDREVFGTTIGDARVQASLVEVSSLVRSRGEAAGAFDVSLLQNGRAIDARRVTPSHDDAPQRVSFTVAPARDTATVYTVEAAAAEGEWTLANNRQSVLAPPADAPRRILLVEGAPGYEPGFLKRSLDEDPGMVVDAIVRKGENERGQPTYYVQAASGRAEALAAGFPVSREALFAYDAVLLVNVEAAGLPPVAAAQLADFVGGRGGGLIVLGARSFEPAGVPATPLQALMPVELTDHAGGLARVTRGAREPFRVSLTDEGAGHPVMRLGLTAADTQRAWEAAPALAATAALGPARPGATLLATTTSPGGVPRPLVAVQRFGRGRVLLFGGEASWRWKMMLPTGSPTYDTFWRQAARWVAADAFPPVAVSLDRGGGRRLGITVNVRDASYAAVGDARVRVQVSSPSGHVIDLPMDRTAQGGTFAGVLDAAESGVHRVTAEARRGATVLGSSEAFALVGGIDDEFVDPRRDEAPLRQLAGLTGGHAAVAGEVVDVAAWIDTPRGAQAEMAQRDLWQSPWVWATIVALLGTEWMLRRRWGLR